MSIEIDYPLGLTGLTVTAKAYGKDAGDVAGTSLSFTENTNRKGFYAVTTSALSAGAYWLQFSVGGSNFDSQWVNVPASGSVMVGGISPGAIDLVQLSAALKGLLVRGYLLTTAVTSPVSADLWFTAGFYNNSPYYQSFTTGLFAWNNGSIWTVSASLGTDGSAYWTTSSGATVIGPYTAQGTATGSPNVVGHGNAVLATFQPDQTLMTSAQVATIPTSGSVARTGDIPVASAIAAATAAVMLVDGSAHPLKVNADHSVLVSSGDVVVENFITVPAAVAAASQSPQVITCLRGDTLRVALPEMGNISSRTKLIMTVKARVSDSDEQAVLQIVEGVGLTRLNGSTSVTAATASLNVTDATAGTVNLVVDASVTSTLAVRDLIWDVQAWLSTGISTPISGTFSVVADVTQAVT